MEAATNRRTFPRELADALRAQILRGDLPAGTLLPPERELAIRLGTNRNTLREALRTLEAQGLVEARQGAGVRVLDFRERGELTLLADYLRVATVPQQLGLLEDLLRLRAMVAREAVARAAEHADEHDFAEFERCLEAVAERVRAHEGTVMEPELALYRAVVRAGKSVAGTWLFNSLEKVIKGFGETYPGLWVTPPRFVEAWRGIVAALVARDGERAERLIGELLERTDAVVVRALGGLPGVVTPRRRKP